MNQPSASSPGAEHDAFHWVPWALVGAAIAAGLLLIPLFGLRSGFALYRGFYHLGDNTFPESTVVLGISRAASGEPVYAEPEPWNVQPMLYAPLTYYLPAWIGQALGMTEFGELRRLARLGALMAHLLAGLLLAEIAFRLGRSSGERFVLPAAALAVWCGWFLVPVPGWSFSVRNDVPHAFFCLLAARGLMAFDERDDLPWPALLGLGGAVVLIASFRQSTLALPGTIVLWLVCRGRWQKALSLLVGLPLGAFLLLLIANKTMPGDLVGAIVRSGAVDYRLSLMRERLSETLPYLLLLAPAAFLWLSAEGARRPYPRTFAIYPLVAFPIAFVLAGKEGSMAVYYRETLWSLVPAAVLGYSMVARAVREHWRSGELRGAPPAEASILASIVILTSLLLGAVAGNYLAGLRGERVPQAEELRAEIDWMQSYAGQAAAMQFDSTSHRAGLPFISPDLYLHKAMVNAGSASWEKLLDLIGSRRYPVIITRGEQDAYEELAVVRRALMDNYEPIDEYRGRVYTFIAWQRK